MNINSNPLDELFKQSLSGHKAAHSASEMNAMFNNVQQAIGNLGATSSIGSVASTVSKSGMALKSALFIKTIGISLTSIAIVGASYFIYDAFQPGNETKPSATIGYEIPKIAEEPNLVSIPENKPTTNQLDNPTNGIIVDKKVNNFIKPTYKNNSNLEDSQNRSFFNTHLVGNQTIVNGSSFSSLNVDKSLQNIDKQAVPNLNQEKGAEKIIESNSEQLANQTVPNNEMVDLPKQSIPCDFQLGEISNILTPNSDGFNDTWEIPVQNAQQIDVQIIDYKGQTIYKSTNPNDKWDGTYMNKGSKQLSEGTYYYSANITKCNGEVIPKRGTITIKTNR